MSSFLIKKSAIDIKMFHYYLIITNATLPSTVCLQCVHGSELNRIVPQEKYDPHFLLYIESVVVVF